MEHSGIECGSQERIEELQRLLHPQVRAFYKQKLNHPPALCAPVDMLRKASDITFNDKVHRESIAGWRDLQIPPDDKTCRAGAIPARVFWPAADGRPRPLLLYFHGGGFVIHNIASHDDLCRRIANAADCVVLSVGYRLAPEHPWPACMEDGYRALLWAFAHVQELCADRSRIALAGDSAGATISAVVSMMHRDYLRGQLQAHPRWQALVRRTAQENRAGCAIEELRIGLQILCYGSFGCLDSEGRDLSKDSDSIRDFGNGGFVLPRSSMEWFMRQYVPKGADEAHPYLNPGRAEDLSGLPKTLCLSAECDPLRDDGEAFARRLFLSKTPVLCRRVRGLMHGFLLYWYRFDQAKEEIGRIGWEIRQAFATC